MHRSAQGVQEGRGGGELSRKLLHRRMDADEALAIRLQPLAHLRRARLDGDLGDDKQNRLLALRMAHHDALRLGRSRVDVQPLDELEVLGVGKAERADAAAADVRRALADPDGAKTEAQEHELVPAGDEGEALLAKLDGATAAAYRKLFEFAASSLGRGAATAADAAQKAAASEAAATDARHPLKRALQALTQRRALYAACRDACGASRRALCVARLKETLAERGAAGDATKTADPARFVSDLLAWTHQTLATEADVARGLFGDDGLKALVGAAVRFSVL